MVGSKISSCRERYLERWKKTIINFIVVNFNLLPISPYAGYIPSFITRRDIYNKTLGRQFIFHQFCQLITLPDGWQTELYKVFTIISQVLVQQKIQLLVDR